MKKEDIMEIMRQVEFNITRNQLVVEYKEASKDEGSDLDKTREIIKKDKDYLEFLQKRCESLES